MGIRALSFRAPLAALLLLRTLAAAQPAVKAAGPHLAIPSPSVPRVLLLGTGNAGVYGSMDGGQTWYPAKRGLQGGVWQVIADPTRPGAVYVTTGDLYHAANHDKSWERVLTSGPSIPDPGYTALATLDTSLLAAGSSGVMVSGDGRHWTMRNRAVWAGAPLQLVATGQDALYAISADGELYAASGGGDLRRQTLDPPSGTSLPSDRATTLGYYQSQSSGELYVALAGSGVCYVPVEHGMPCKRLSTPGSGPVRALLASDWDTVFAAVAGQGLWCSANQGETWQPAQGDKPFTITALTRMGKAIVAATQGQGVQIYSASCPAPNSSPPPGTPAPPPFAWISAATGVPSGILGLSFASMPMFTAVPQDRFGQSPPAGYCDTPESTGRPSWAGYCFRHYYQDVISRLIPPLKFIGEPITPPVYDDQADSVCPGQERLPIAQYFERVRFEYCPRLPHHVGLTPLGQLLMPLRYHHETASVCQTRDLWPGLDAASGPYTLSGQFYQYWKNHQGASLLGLPISPPHDELNADGSGFTYLVQYLTNARLEWHEDLSDARYNVELGLLGYEYLDSLWQTRGFGC